MVALVSVLLPDPGRPGDADEVPVAAERMGQAGDLTGLVATALDQRQQAGQRGAVAVAGSTEQLGNGTGAACHLVDVDDFGHTVDSITHDALDAGLQRAGARRARAAGADEGHRDHAGLFVDVAQHDVAAVGLQRRADDFDGFFDLGTHGVDGSFDGGRLSLKQGRP